MNKKIMLAFGTRPEAMKMCPLVKELKTRDKLDTVVCVTGQDRQMLDQVLNAFNVVPDYDLSIMKSKQILFDVTINILEKMKTVLEEVTPDVVVVHGDTSTCTVPEVEHKKIYNLFGLSGKTARISSLVKYYSDHRKA